MIGLKKNSGYLFEQIAMFKDLKPVVTQLPAPPLLFSSETITEKILILITPTVKDGCMWELEGETIIKCFMQDKVFFEKYKSGSIALRGREMMLVKLKTIQKLVRQNHKEKVKNEYYIMEIAITQNPELSLFEQAVDGG